MSQPCHHGVGNHSKDKIFATFPITSRNLRVLYKLATMDSWLRNVGSGLANAGKVTHDSLYNFGQNAGTALDSWGKEMGKDLDPNHPLHIAMTKTGEISFAVARGSLRHLDGFGQHTEKSVTQAYGQLHQHVSKMDWQKLPSEARAWVECTATNLGIAVSAAKKNVLGIKEAELPGEIAQWIRDHPGQTAFIIAAGIVFFAPDLITAPVLASLGFTAGGVAAGELDTLTVAQVGKS